MDVSKLFAKPKGDPESVPVTHTPVEVFPETDEEELVLKRPISAIASISAALPQRHPLSARFHEILKEVGELHDKKQIDYGTKEDPFANIRGATEFGVASYVGAFMEMNSCMQKVKALSQNKRLENDPVENVLKDMAVFSIIALVLFEEENGSKDL